MARKIKLTDARISRLKAEDVEYMVWDTRIAGFGIRVRPSGHKSYVYLGLWKKVRKLTGLEDVRLHDLRHTCASLPYSLAA